jgi:molybdate transport system substrate-binding protein
MAVKEGAPKVDISTPENVKAAILNAKFIAYSGGPSGLYVEKMIGTMGLLDQVKPKMKLNPAGVRAAPVLVSGEADLGFQQMSEFVHEPGITILGLLPDSLQNWTVWASAIPNATEQASAAKELQTFLISSQPVWKANGIEPVSK